MKEDRRLLVRAGILGLLVSSLLTVVGCSEPEPPKVIDVESKPKIPQKQGDIAPAAIKN